MSDTFDGELTYAGKLSKSMSLSSAMNLGDDSMTTNLENGQYLLLGIAVHCYVSDDVVYGAGRKIH